MNKIRDAGVLLFGVGLGGLYLAADPLRGWSYVAIGLVALGFGGSVGKITHRLLWMALLPVLAFARDNVAPDGADVGYPPALIWLVAQPAIVSVMFLGAWLFRGGRPGRSGTPREKTRK